MSKQHPLEQFEFNDIETNDYVVDPEAMFSDEDGHPTAMTHELLTKTIQHCRRYGMKRDHFDKAMVELQPHQDIYVNMKDEDVLPIQR